MLALHELSVSRAGRTAVANVSLEISTPGLLFLVGPGGCGKSSLLHALSGCSDVEGLATTGFAAIAGRPLRCVSIASLGQHDQLDGAGSLADALRSKSETARHDVSGWLARHAPDLLGSEHLALGDLSRATRRWLAVLVALELPADLYLLDEPTAALEAVHVPQIRSRIAQIARNATVVVATHNRHDCLELGGTTALLAGHALQEVQASDTFFDSPHSTAGRAYVASGYCSVVAPAATRDTQQGLWWITPQLLGGACRPGMLEPLDYAWATLGEQGVSQLFCLEETVNYALTGLRQRAIAHYHFPVVDMSPPGFSQAVDICRLAEPAIRDNRGVVIHCRGGLGRTGTMLGAVLVWFGDDPTTAIAKVRAVQRYAIQTQAQMRFVHDFADRIHGWHPRVIQPGVPHVT